MMRIDQSQSSIDPENLKRNNWVAECPTTRLSAVSHVTFDIFPTPRIIAVGGSVCKVKVIKITNGGQGLL